MFSCFWSTICWIRKQLNLLISVKLFLIYEENERFGSKYILHTQCNCFLWIARLMSNSDKLTIEFVCMLYLNLFHDYLLINVITISEFLFVYQKLKYLTISQQITKSNVNIGNENSACLYSLSLSNELILHLYPIFLSISPILSLFLPFSLAIYFLSLYRK